MPQHITVKDYCREWERDFEKEAEKIRKILKGNLIDVYHIGSTAVPGMKAKPILDIMPVVKDLIGVDEVKDAFEQAGYEYLGEYGISGRRYLRKGGDERTHQIHIFQNTDGKNIRRHLAVRDYLIAHPDIAKAYGELKADLAAKFPYDIEGYCDGKEVFMKRLEKTALDWYVSLEKTP